MDYLTITKENLIKDNEEIIIWDYNNIPYMSLIDTQKLFGFQRSFIYRLIKDEKLDFKDYGSSRFISIESIWNEIEKKARKMKEDMVKGHLTNLASEQLEKIVSEIQKDIDSNKSK
jgi:hypothetical protein